MNQPFLLKMKHYLQTGWQEIVLEIGLLHLVYNLESVAIQSASVFVEFLPFSIQQMAYRFQVVEFDQKEFYELISYSVFPPINSILKHSEMFLTPGALLMIDHFSF